MKNRRGFLKSLCRTAAVYSFEQLMHGQPLPVSFVNVAREAGLREKTVFGDEKKNRYLVETTGCGVAFYDYDHDGWLDLFFVNGSRFQANFTGGLPSN
ncbi:MAG: CRTAC1 family protein, partial [Acidobacteria bacterium]|nr:CRTAC1 family protein [Acidobacteriota bacterium]